MFPTQFHELWSSEPQSKEMNNAAPFDRQDNGTQTGEERSEPLDLFDQDVEKVLGEDDKNMRDQVDSLDCLLLNEANRLELAAFEDPFQSSRLPAVSESVISDDPTGRSQQELPHGSIPDFRSLPVLDLPRVPEDRSVATTVSPQKAKNELKQVEAAKDDNFLKKPKRSLSAYNLFFQAERKKLLQQLPVPRDGKKPKNSHGKCGFAEMARTIAAKWKLISADEKLDFEYLAALDTERYEREMAVWKKWNTEREMEEWRKSQQKAMAKEK